MAETLLMIGKSCFAAIGLLVGARLLWTAFAERRLGLPALVSGAIFIGGLGLVLIPVGMSMGDSRLGWWTTMVGEFSERAGMILLALFVRQVFRPKQAIGWIGLVVCTLALGGTLIWDLLSQHTWWRYDISLPSAYASQLAIALPLAWSSIESFVCWRRLRRRAAIGLGEPVACNRFALWTVATSSFVGICLLAIAAGQATQAGATGLASAAQIGRAVLFMLISVAVWLGMFPAAGLRTRLGLA
jgi:hypothetical protein